MCIVWNKTSPGIETATASSAIEFIETLRPSNSHWWENGSCPWIFRGHASESWKLLPSAWRDDNLVMKNCIEEATRRVQAGSVAARHLNWIWPPNFLSGSATFGASDHELSKQLTIRTTSEYLPIWDFANLSDEIGINVPLAGPAPDPTQDPNWTANPAYPLYEDELLRFSDMPSALALAQHHGIPTRLLDWTNNPMAAAYFAMEPILQPTEDAFLIVWALHKAKARNIRTEGVSFPNAPQDAQQLDPHISILRILSRDNVFLKHQSGLFTSLNFSGIYFMKNSGERPDIESFLENSGVSFPVLRKLRLSHKYFRDLEKILSYERVSRSRLMPTLDNVSAEVRAKWSGTKIISI